MSTCWESMSIIDRLRSGIPRRLAFACGVILAASTAAPASAQSGGSAEWNKIVAAAKTEGTVVISYFTDPGVEPILKQFEKQFGIKVEASAGRPNEIVPKILTEQKNGQFNWDVLVQPVSNVRLVLEPVGGLEPILPFLVLPEVKDDSKWHGGVTGKIPMNPLFVFYDGIAGPQNGFQVNRDKVSRQEVSNWKDLLKPEWKGKFGIYYPRRPANLTIGLACSRPAFESDKQWEDYVRAFFAQKPIALPQFRGVADWLAKGRYDLVVGADGSYLDELKAKLKLNVDDQVGENFCQGSPYGTGRSLAVPKNPPHRNAAKVFINWYLTKDIQEAVVKAYRDMGWKNVSRRTDVEDPEPEYRRAVIDKFQKQWMQGKGLMMDGDQGLALQERVIKIAEESGY